MMRLPLYALAGAACLSVFLLNGGLLFYFDTIGYLAKGEMALDLLGLGGTPAGDGATGTPAGAAPGQGPEQAQAVDGSHSLIYALLLGGLARLGLLDMMVLVNSGLVLIASWLITRVHARGTPTGRPPALLCLAPLAVAGLTALPFYTAFLMPDIFTPLLILLVALVTVFRPELQRGELVAVFLLGSLSVGVHLSHFAILAALVPLCAIGAVLLRQKRWWLSPLLVALMLVLPLTERSLFRISVETVSQGQATVVYKPFITARLIQDGPGYTWLERNCPDAAIPSCDMWTALQFSDDPYRLTASHIVFETSPELGSYKLLPTESQARIAGDQVAFFGQVLLELPLQTALAFARNMTDQLVAVSVSQTIPGAAILQRLDTSSGLPGQVLSEGRLGDEDRWAPQLTALHLGLYGLSALLVLGLMAAPGRMSPQMRVFAAMVLLGILVNALVCGGLSQPAPRYGARVAWLLPYLATFLALIPAETRKSTARA